MMRMRMRMRMMPPPPPLLGGKKDGELGGLATGRHQKVHQEKAQRRRWLPSLSTPSYGCKPLLSTIPNAAIPPQYRFCLLYYFFQCICIYVCVDYKASYHIS